MTLGRDFRLPKDVRPRRYALRFDLDLDAWTFRGNERVEIGLGSPRGELYLHAVDLEIGSALARREGTELAPAVSLDAKAEVAMLRFPEALDAGSWTLELAFSGGIRPDLKAIYRSTRGDERYAVTQFAAADARRAFPCFDEPEFKARFALELIGPSQATAIANMRQLAAEELGGGRTLWRFAETPPISSYLLAFAVGPFEGTAVVRTKSGIPVRVWLPRGMAAEGLYARDAHREAIEWLEEYTGIAYPYDKVEGLGIPDFSAGAMENPGAVTYRLRVLAADPQKASLAALKQCYEYVAHELTHMWWGDLVTFAWWDDIWLNEAFATFVGHKANDALRPGWRFWRDFLWPPGQLPRGFELDALVSTHPISTPARTVEEANQRFDAISYLKGGAVLRMLEAYLGEETFRRGVRIYLERHREANATAGDFWRALDEASAQDVSRIASAWITEPGHPLVEVRLDSEQLVTLRQRRFFTDAEAPPSAQRWPIPLALRVNGRTVRTMLDREEGSLQIPPGAWVFPNADSAGFYRYALDEALYARLLPRVRELAPEERLGFVDDVWALLIAGVIGSARYVDLLRSLEGESDRVVLTIVFDQLQWLSVHAITAELREPFAALVARLYGPQLARLGWAGAADEPEDDQQLRPGVIRALGELARDATVRAEAARRLLAHLDGARADRNVVQALAVVAATQGDVALQRRYLAHMKNVALTDVQEETRFRLALSSFADPGAVDATLVACFDGTIRDQDVRFNLHEGLRNLAARDAFWRAIRERWDAQIAPWETSLRNAVLSSLTQLTPARYREEVRAFLLAKRREDSVEVTAQALERLRLDTAAAERIASELSSALGALAVS